MALDIRRFGLHICLYPWTVLCVFFLVLTLKLTKMETAKKMLPFSVNVTTIRRLSKKEIPVFLRALHEYHQLL